MSGPLSSAPPPVPNDNSEYVPSGYSKANVTLLASSAMTCRRELPIRKLSPTRMSTAHDPSEQCPRLRPSVATVGSGGVVAVVVVVVVSVVVAISVVDVVVRTGCATGIACPAVIVVQAAAASRTTIPTNNGTRRLVTSGKLAATAGRGPATTPSCRARLGSAAWVD